MLLVRLFFAHGERRNRVKAESYCLWFLLVTASTSNHELINKKCKMSTKLYHRKVARYQLETSLAGCQTFHNHVKIHR